MNAVEVTAGPAARPRARSGLRRLEEPHWRAGLRAVLRAELRGWFASRRWALHAVLWTVVLNGLLALLLWVVPELEAVAGAGGDIAPTESVVEFFDMMSLLLSAGVIVAAHGAVLDQRADGVLEWLLSKPLSRPALVGAKALANGAGLVTAMLIAPFPLVYLQASAAGSAPWPLGRFVAAVAILAVLVAFVLALTLLVGTVLRSRAAVLGSLLAVTVGVPAVAQLAPALVEWSPWSLGAVAGVVAVGHAAPLGPLVVSAVLAGGCLAGTVWRLHQERR